MNLSNDELAQVTQYAALGYSINEVAEIMELSKLDFNEACKTEGTAIFKAYKSGFYATDAKLRLEIIKQAVENSSSPAQIMLDKMLKESKIKNL